MNSYVRNLLAMLTATIVAIGTTQPVHAAKFLGLGDLAGGEFSSVANGLSANGSVVVGYGQTAAIGSEAYRWTSGSGMVGLGDLVGGDFSSAANGVSADGSVVIGLGNSAAGQEAFRWTIADGMHGLGDLDGGDVTSGAYGVSADGSVVVGFGNNAAFASEPFRWTSGSGPVGLGDLEGGNFFSFAFGVSADGSVVVGQGHNSDFATEAFRWTSSGGMVGLGDLEGGIFRSIANGVSSDGSVVVGYGIDAAFVQQAFRWTAADGMIGLGVLDGGFPGSSAAGVSADGSVVVGNSNTAEGSEAFIWDAANGMRRVKEVLLPSIGAALDGWKLTEARAVSADGRTIVGRGFNPDGRQEAWLAYLPDQVFWFANTSGAWDGANSWSGPFLPGPADDVIVDPAVAVTVTGPAANRVVNTLSVGGSGMGRVTLRLAGAANGDLRASSFAYFYSNAEFVLADGHTFSAAVLYNSGLIRGTGTVHADLVNYAGGDVRVAAGEALVVSGGGHTNDGKFEVVNGSLEFVGPLFNNVGTGLIAGRGATLRFQGGLTNEGAMALSTGISDVHGDIANNGRVVLSGHATATFYDDVTNNGAINVAAGSSAVFFGDLSGNGVGGGGEVFLEGDTRPGFSPGVMSFGGDVHLGALASLAVDLGGAQPGAEHDQLAVAGSIEFGGTLAVALTGNFGPIAGDQFVLATYGSRSGTFAVSDLPPLPPNLSWLLAYNATELVLTTTMSFSPGDIDLDHDVDRADAALFSGFYGKTGDATWATGDFDFDGATTLADWALLQANFGAARPSPAASAPVPEPATWMLTLLAGIVLVWKRSERLTERSA